MDQDRKSLSCNLVTSGIGENLPALSFENTLNRFLQKEDPWFAESMVTDASNIVRQIKSSPERRPMVRKTRPERAPVQFRRIIYPDLDGLLNRGHTTGILIERLEPAELAEDELESIELLFEQYDKKVEINKAGKLCNSTLILLVG